VDFGIHIGTRGCLTSRENVMAVAQRAEALGYAYLGVADHLIVPVQTGVRYPYTADGIWPGAPTGECFDCIATLAFLAGCTQRLKLLTSVAVVPYRPAVLTAKLFMTADVLSGGRVIAGIGTGWMREEFEALGTPPFAERGAVTDDISPPGAHFGTSSGRRSTADTRSSTTLCSSRSRPPGRICRSGSAAKARRRCGGR
jgi:alkanesulfonate monooxygenase SsuD/methylene tetrahydromethanopterin reductase-like flavin-dependent oxidoreductase (luciferase family)